MHGNAGAMLGAKLTCDSCVLPAGRLHPERRAGREKKSQGFNFWGGCGDRWPCQKVRKEIFCVLLEGKAVREHGSYQAPASPSQMVEDAVNEVS